MALDRNDIEQFYSQYGPMVFRRCRQLLGNEERAREAMQDVFVKVLSSADQLKDTAPSSFLYRVATNICLNLIRSGRRRPESVDADILERIAHASHFEDAVGARHILAKLFAHHHDSTAHIAVLHLVDGLTLEQVADEVGLSVSGVRKRLRKLKASLMELETV